MRAGRLLPVLFLLVITGCGGPGHADAAADLEHPVPTFSSNDEASGADGDRAERKTVLPSDCAKVLGGVDMSALLGQPVDSVRSRAIPGQPSPSVGRVERMTCVYQLASDLAGPPAVQLKLGAYVDESAAVRQYRTNLRAARTEAVRVEERRIGTAPAAVLTELGQSVLMVANGRTTATIVVRKGTVAEHQTIPVLLDLAQRVLPNLVPRDHPGAR